MLQCQKRKGCYYGCPILSRWDAPQFAPIGHASAAFTGFSAALSPLCGGQGSILQALCVAPTPAEPMNAQQQLSESGWCLLGGQYSRSGQPAEEPGKGSWPNSKNCRLLSWLPFPAAVEEISP